MSAGGGVDAIRAMFGSFAAGACPYRTRIPSAASPAATAHGLAPDSGKPLVELIIVQSFRSPRLKTVGLDQAMISFGQLPERTIPHSTASAPDPTESDLIPDVLECVV